MLGDITQDTIDMTKGILASGPQNLRLPSSANAQKSGITVGSNYLYGYPLEAPSKKLYPIEDAIRRRIARFVNPVGGTYAHWKQVTSINANRVAGAVLEGAVNTALTITDAERSAAYRTLMSYNNYTDEARFMGRKFEDIPAATMLFTLQDRMQDEDIYIIGGQDAVLGAPTGLAAADSATAGSLSASTNYDYAVSALTLRAYLDRAVTWGRTGGVDNAGETDAGTLTNFTTGALGGSQAVDLTWTRVKGAFAYNVFIGTHSGTLYYSQTVTVNAATVTSAPGAGHTNNSADKSAVTNVTTGATGYQGIVQQAILGSYGNGYYKTCDNAELTGDAAAGITEVDEMLKSIWDNGRIGPTLMIVNSQESLSMKRLAIGNAATSPTRIMLSGDEKNQFKAGAGVGAYWNPFTNQWIEIITSTHTAPGTIIAVAERVPYPNAETPNNLEVELQQEYYGEEFARTTRQQPIGVTSIGALKLYYALGCGVIANIKGTT